MLERWASVFGGTNIVVRPYERQQYAPDIVIDMLRTIAHDLGRRVDDFPFLDRISSPRRNASFSPSALQLMEIFQRAELPPEVRERLLRHARSGSAVEPKQSTLSPGRRLELIEENAADYAYIAREYMGREDGRLFYDPLPDPDEPWEPPKPLAPGQIVEETVKALLGEADLAS
ncbi:hypothetical protein CKO23_14965 [Thiocystis violacea]|nr:hypothetical protein [Thiocystis violacea]